MSIAYYKCKLASNVFTIKIVVAMKVQDCRRCNLD